MKKTLLLPCILFYYYVLSQTPNSVSPDDKIVSERIFIHTDKSTCIAGDTVWFKAYLFDGNQPGSLSTNLFVELADEQSHIIFKQKLPVFNGTTSGFFPITDSLQHGFYFLRAYTPQMLLSSQQIISSKVIAVMNIGYVLPKYMKQTPAEYKILFYPESGNLVTGLSNTVAFRVSDQNGNGLNTPVLISNVSGDTIAYISSPQNGLGAFSFTPLTTEKYSAEIIVENKKKKFDLPVFHKDGVLLSVAENSKGKIYLVQKSPELFVNEKAELLGIMFDNIVFRQPLKFENNEASGLIPLKDLPPGILHLSVVNENEQVFAFRPVMINKTDIYADVLFSKDTVGFSPKAKNVFSFRLPDTTEGNLSVSVIALNSTNAAIENNSITNSILIDAESSLPAIHQQRFKGEERSK